MRKRLGPLDRRTDFFWIFFGAGKFSEKCLVKIVWRILEDGGRAWKKMVMEGWGVSNRPTSKCRFGVGFLGFGMG
jgi:hypothetical protein